MLKSPRVVAWALVGFAAAGCGARTGLVDASRDGGDTADATATNAPDAPTAVGEPPGAPKLLFPVSTGVVTSRRPELRWSLAPASSGVHLQLCRDRACREVVVERDVADTTFEPTQELSPGVWFWRAWGRRDGAMGAVASPTWQFTVGARSAPINTSWGTVPDFDGDGYADVVVAATGLNRTGSGSLSIFPGGPMGVAPSPSRSIAAPTFATFASSMGSAGDVDGDGFADLVVGAPTDGGRAGVFVYRGGPGGLGPTPTRLEPPGGAGDGFGVVVGAAGDVDGDGYGDVIVGAPLRSGGPGGAYLYRGGPAGLRVDAPVRLGTRPETGPDFGRAVAGACDFNGDGYADVAISEAGIDVPSGVRRGIVSLYLGRPGSPGAADATLTAQTGDEGGDFAQALACAGDFNGDGRTDLLVGDPRPAGVDPRAYVFLAAERGQLSRPRAILTIPAGAGRSAGASVAAAGDLDGDGYGDVVVGDGIAGNSGLRGRVLVFRGHGRGPGPVSASVLDAPGDGPATFGLTLASGGTGDLDGDGFADLLVGAPDLGTRNDGRAYVFRGSARGADAASVRTLRGSGPSGDGFGSSVACGSRLSPRTRGAAPRGRASSPTSPPSRALPARARGLGKATGHPRRARTAAATISSIVRRGHAGDPTGQCHRRGFALVD
jgi:hypothetical protein